MATEEIVKEALFKVGGLVEPPYFVGREEELERLCNDARHLTQSNLILAPRRFGKSSLLHNIKKQLQDEEQLLIPYVNCREITSYADFHRVTVAALLSEYESKTRVAGLLEAFRFILKERVLRAVQRVEEIGGSLSEVGRVYLRFREQEVEGTELARAAFRFFHSFAEEKSVRVVFLLDEFQEVAGFNGFLFNLFKKELDEVPNVRYFFSGSSMRMLSSIFLREDAPLYLMVSRHYMEPLRENTVADFVRQRLAIAGLAITNPAVRLLHALTGGIPYYIQKLGVLVVQSAFLRSTAKITASQVRDGFDAMLEELDSEFEVRWFARFSNQQRTIVKTLAQLGEVRMKDIAAEMRVQRYDISSAVNRLRDMMILATKSDGSYYIVDCVFAAWLNNP